MFNEKFWLAISFFIFISLFIKYVGPAILRALDGLSSKVAADIHNADKLRQEANRLLLEAKEYNENTLQYCRTMLEDVKIEISSLKNDAQKALNHEIEVKMIAALDRVKTQEERVIRGLKVKIINESINVIRSNLVQSSPKKINDNFVTQSIEEISRI